MPHDSPLTIWCGSTFSPPAQALFEEGAAKHRLLPAGSASDAAVAEAEVAFGQPELALVLNGERLRWVHVTSAGYTRYDRDDVREALRARAAALTNSSHVYDEPCAQHALAMILALARQLPQCLDDQRAERPPWRTGAHRARSFLLGGDQTVLLLGFGAIARRLVELLAPFGVNLLAVRRTVQGDEGIPVVGEAELEGALAAADHVVNLLPDNASTRGYLSAARFAAMRPGARVYNIGRGTTVDQDALLAALSRGRVASAYLDVTDPEPLPPDHPLWTAPNCFITPHSAGGHAGEDERLVRHFLRNLAAFEQGEPLADRVM
jgi:phosphoglycerate dehydrogenase-like enzyme